ncbi:MAG: hypothetical protein ACREDK_04740 [Thermoplasmata archaeon]
MARPPSSSPHAGAPAALSEGIGGRTRAAGDEESSLDIAAEWGTEAPDRQPTGGFGVFLLFLSLIGVVGFAAMVYWSKFYGGPVLAGLPSREVFVVLLALACSPFVLALWHRHVPLLYLAVPTTIVFLLGPLMSPYGLPAFRDDIFNLQFAQSLLTYSSWVPGQGVTAQAVTYSYYPGSGVFNAETSQMLGLPLLTTFQWGLPLLRLLVIPTGVYAITSRLYGSRAGVLAIFLYMAVPSIVLNEVVQQEFGMIFFLLTLLAMVALLDRNNPSEPSLRFCLLIFSSYVVVSHHLTSYVLAFWLGVIAVIPLLVRGRVSVPWLRTGPTAARYFAFFLFYVLVLTSGILYKHLSTLTTYLTQLIQGVPPSGHVAQLGSAFTPGEIGWILASVVFEILLALLLIFEVTQRTRLTFVVANLFAAVALMVGGLVLFPTPFNFIALRVMEYAGLIVCPASAWWLIRRYVQRRPLPPRPSALPRRRPAESGPTGMVPFTAALAVLLVFAGGSLITITTRDQFAPSSTLLSDSSLFITQQAYHDVQWADSHLNRSHYIWGDYLVYSTFGGFGGFGMHYDNFYLFNGTSLSAGQYGRLAIGDYVILDAYLTKITPEFFGPSTDQPSAPLSIAEVGKFSDPTHFHVRYTDSLFTIYEVTNITP